MTMISTCSSAESAFEVLGAEGTGGGWKDDGFSRAARVTAIFAPTRALSFINAMFASRLRPLVALRTRWSRKGVISFPEIPRLSHSLTASVITSSISDCGIAWSCGMGLNIAIPESRFSNRFTSSVNIIHRGNYTNEFCCIFEGGGIEG